MPVRTRSSSRPMSWFENIPSSSASAFRPSSSSGLGSVFVPPMTGGRNPSSSSPSRRRRQTRPTGTTRRTASNLGLDDDAFNNDVDDDDDDFGDDPIMMGGRAQGQGQGQEQGQIRYTSPSSSTGSMVSSDAVLRNVAVVSLVLAIGLLFLNVALYIGVILTMILIPAWRTFKQLERVQVDRTTLEIDGDDDDVDLQILNNDLDSIANERVLRNWHKYWIVFGILLSAHAFFIRPFFSSFIPSSLYHALLLCVASWLNANSAGNAAVLYDTVVKPSLCRSEHAIDVCVESVVSQIDSFSRHFILAVNQAVEPYARQLEHAAHASRRQMEEQARRNNIATNYFD